MKHPSIVIGWNGSLAELAQAVGNMSYDQTTRFIDLLADDIRKQANNDWTRGKTRLAAELYKTADALFEATVKMDDAWKICERYMKEVDDERNPRSPHNG